MRSGKAFAVIDRGYLVRWVSRISVGTPPVLHLYRRLKMKTELYSHVCCTSSLQATLWLGCLCGSEGRGSEPYRYNRGLLCSCYSTPLYPHNTSISSCQYYRFATMPGLCSISVEIPDDLRLSLGKWNDRAAYAHTTIHQTQRSTSRDMEETECNIYWLAISAQKQLIRISFLYSINEQLG